MAEELQLEVGKTYEVRDTEYAKLNDQPTEVTIIQYDRHANYPYTCDQYQTYATTGRVFFHKETPYDLVRELPAPATNQEEK